jgi:hypothetical protein
MGKVSVVREMGRGRAKDLVEEREGGIDEGATDAHLGKGRDADRGGRPIVWERFPRKGEKMDPTIKIKWRRGRKARENKPCEAGKSTLVDRYLFGQGCDPLCRGADVVEASVGGRHRDDSPPVLDVARGCWESGSSGKGRSQGDARGECPDGRRNEECDESEECLGLELRAHSPPPVVGWRNQHQTLIKVLSFFILSGFIQAGREFARFASSHGMPPEAICLSSDPLWPD